jgi:tRNA(Ile)-lysidine synthase
VAGGGLLPCGRTVVAISGGPDSVALLLLLRELNIELVAAHFDHRMRPGSGADADRVAELCRGLGVRLVRGSRESPLGPGSRQAAARSARYAFLEATREAEKAAEIATGHTADDVIEGLLLHLERGAALAGARGMPDRRNGIVRPLLGIWRAEIEEYLGEFGIEPLRDPSNIDLSYARVRVRLHLLPALERARPGIKGRLYGAARAAAQLQEQLEARVGEEGVASTSAVVRMETYRRLYVGAGGSAPGLNRRQLLAVDRLRESGVVNLPGGLVARRFGGEVHVEPVMAPQQTWRLETRPCAGCMGGAAAHLKTGLRLSLGTRRPGLRLRPLPGGHLRKLQDVLVDAHVPRHLRDRLPIVFADGEPAWIPGVAVDARHVAKPGESSVHVEVRPGSDRV